VNIEERGARRGKYIAWSEVEIARLISLSYAESDDDISDTVEIRYWRDVIV